MVKREFTPFQQALLDSVLEDYQKLMADVPKNTDSLIEEFRAANKQQKHIPTIRRRIARAALIAVIIIALLAVSVMAIPAIRIAVVEFFLRENSDSYGITFDPDAAATAPAVIEQEYEIAYLPKNYSLHSLSSLSKTNRIVWTNTLGEEMLFLQQTIAEWQQNTHFSVDAGSSKETVLMGDYLVTVILRADIRMLIWTDNEYFYLLRVPTSVSEEDVNKIFASWGPKK